MNPKQETSQEDIDVMNALLDKNLADIEDLPEYLDRIGNGFYKLKFVSHEKKGVEIDGEEKGTKIKVPVIQFVIEIKQVIELEDKDGTPPKEGSRFNVSFFFNKDPEKGVAALKAMFSAEMAAALNTTSLLQLVDKTDGLEVAASVKCKADKKKDDKFYISVRGCQLV